MSAATALEQSPATRLLISGEWRDSGDGAEIEVVDPATGGVDRVGGERDRGDAAAAVAAAAEAGRAWAATPPRERSECCAGPSS